MPAEGEAEMGGRIMGKIKVGVLGATGAVGQRLVRLLNDHPWFETEAMSGSERSAGKVYRDTIRPMPSAAGYPADHVLDMRLVASEPEAFSGCKVVFSALPAEVARDLEPR